jgi:hypothetical protein
MEEATAAGREALDALAQEYADDPRVRYGTMFRSPGLRVDGRIFAFLGHGDRLIVKLPRDRAVELMAAGAAHDVTMGTRTMKEWVALPLGDAETWRDYAREACTYVSALAAEAPD